MTGGADAGAATSRMAAALVIAPAELVTTTL